MNIIYETVVAETRKSRLDYYARTKFIGEGEEITESRMVIDEMLVDAEPMSIETKTLQSAARMQSGFEQHGLVEVG